MSSKNPHARNGKKLSDIASLTKTDVGTVVDDLLSESVAAKLDRLAAIQEGLDDIAAGRIVDYFKAVVADLAVSPYTYRSSFSCQTGPQKIRIGSYAIEVKPL